MNQGTAKMDIFETSADRRRFLALLAEVEQRFGLEVHAYVLMGNHFHLLVRSRHARLSAAMHWLEMRYAKYFNRSRGRVGAFFRGRFTSRLVEDEAYLAWLPIYIHINPVKDGYVSSADEWRWSSYRQVVGLTRGHEWLASGQVGRGVAVSEYRRRTQQAAGQPCPPTRPATADDVWESWAGVAAASTLPVEQIETGVADVFDEAPAALRRPAGNRSNPARTLAIGMLLWRSDLTRADIADRYGLSSPGAVSSATRRAKHLLTDAALIAKLRSVGLQ